MGRKLFIYGFPGDIGGADTKMDHTLPLLKEIFGEVMCVANAPSQYEGGNKWTRYLDSLGIKYGLRTDMKDYREGDIALSLCNPYFFNQGFCDDAKSKGLKVVWSSEMMWHHNKELEYVNKGMVDKVLYVSEVQKAALTYPKHIPSTITGNYIDADRFPFQRRGYDGLSIGRLSRADSYKYTEDFPVFYEEMVEGLPNSKIVFRIMAWDEKLADKYKWHNWRRKWSWIMFKPLQIPALDFLHTLDVQAYPLGHNFVESWGRSTVEGMLTGCIPISFSGHHIDKLISHGESGYIANDIHDWRSIVHTLFHDRPLKEKMAKRTSEYAREVLCNRNEHLEIWKTALDV